MEEYKTLKTFNDSVEANLAKNYLLDNGIEAILTDEYAGEIFSTVVRGIKLKTLEQDYTRASELLQQLKDQYDKQDENGVDEEVIEILEDCDALLDGHFQLTSGLHSGRYIEKIRVIQQPENVVRLAEKLVEKLEDTNPDIIIGMAMGGIVLGYEVAKELGKEFIFVQRKDGKMTVRSGFKLFKGMKAIIIEDIVTTGGSVNEVIELLHSLGIKVLAVGLLVDRSGGEVDFGVRTESLLKLNIRSYKPEECPLCNKEVPLSVPGSSDKKT